MLPHSPAHRALLALLASAVLLALGPMFVRLAASPGGVGPVAAGFWRLALAVPFLGLLARAGGAAARPALDRRALGLLALGGVAFAADLAAWHVGILHTRIANATLLGNSAAFLFAVYGFLAARRWPSGREGAGLGLAAVGVALLLGRSAELSPQNLLGDALCLLAGLFYTVYLVVMERMRGRLAPMPALLASTVAGVGPLLLAAIAMGDTVWPDRWWPLILLALSSQLFGQGLLTYAVGHLAPLVVGVGLLLQLVFAAASGWIVYDERLAAADVGGAAALAVALLLVRTRRALPEDPPVRRTLPAETKHLSSGP